MASESPYSDYPETPTTHLTTFDHGKEILVMNIDVGEGQFDQLIVHEEDEPDDLARAFCMKHGLKEGIESALTQQIEVNIDELIREQCVNVQKTHLANEKKQLKTVRREPKAVFDRLHVQGKRKNTVETEPHKQSNSPVKRYPYSNAGHKLYYKGLRSRENKEKQCIEQHKSQEKELNRSLTFRPRINQKSSQLTNRDPSSKPEEELIRKGRRTQELLAQKREQQLASDVKGLTFVPNINTRCALCRSAKLAVRSRSQDTFRSLYEEATRRKEKLEESFSQCQGFECPFKPTVNHPGGKPEEPVELRLLKYQQQAEESMEKYSLCRTRSQIYQLKDPVTGQDFFRPKTGRSPRKVNKPKPEPVPDSHSLSKKKEDDFLTQRLRNGKEKSTQMVLKRKLDRLQDLFTLLHPDDSGYISVQTIIVEDLDRDTLRIIAPVLEELEDLNQSLNFPEFADAMEELMKTLIPDDKAALLGFRKKTPEAPTLVHSPEILPYKFSPANQDRLQRPIYDRLMSYKKATETKVREEKDKRFQAEMAECSFKPNIEPLQLKPAHAEDLTQS